MGVGGMGNAAGGAGGAGMVSVPPFMLDCPQPALGSPTLRQLTRAELQNTLTDIFPEVAGQWTTSLPANQVTGYGFDNDGAATVGTQQAGALLETALSLATAVTGTRLANILPCSATAPDRACAEQYLLKYGRRLFRRPLAQAERDRYLTFFDSSMAQADFKTGIKWMTAGLIQSPSAIYRSEIGVTRGTGRELSPFEVATELAYTFTGTTPSDALLTMAEAGSVGDPVTMARTMLATPQGKEMLQRFFAAYLDYNGVTSIQKPNISTFASVSADMVQETRAFISDVVFQKNGGLKELLTSATANPSRALASYYGFNPPATDYASIPRPTGRGVGVLALGSFLATHAASDSSSPTKRGLLPFRKLLCEVTEGPPPTVPKISPPQPGQKTTRARYEEQHAVPNSSCAGCHSRFDPIGFGFEHFDEGGRYRDTEGGLTINTAATVSNPDKSPMFSFDGQEDLMTRLSAQPVIHQCFAAYLATWAFGTGESCLAPSQVSQLQSGAIGVTEAFARLATEPHFSKRNAR
jgi:hypothetical protein